MSDYTSTSDVLHLELPSLETFILKLEGLNPTGSIKLKTAMSMVRQAQQDGTLAPGGHIIESSSGNMGIALASIAASEHYSATIVCDPNTSNRAIKHMRALGANVVVVNERDPQGGFLGTRLATVERYLNQDRFAVWLNQYANEANWQAHEKQTLPEIINTVGQPDWLFVGVGTAGTITGCLRGIRKLSLNTQLVAVDSVGSITLGGKPGPRFIPGLGSSIPSHMYQQEDGVREVYVSEVEAITACRKVARTTGVLLGGSSGSVIAAASHLIDEINPSDTVVAICPDMGEKYLDTIYDDEWVAAHYQDGPR